MVSFVLDFAESLGFVGYLDCYLGCSVLDYSLENLVDFLGSVGFLTDYVLGSVGYLVDCVVFPPVS